MSATTSCLVAAEYRGCTTVIPKSLLIGCCLGPAAQEAPTKKVHRKYLASIGGQRTCVKATDEKLLLSKFAGYCVACVMLSLQRAVRRRGLSAKIPELLVGCCLMKRRRQRLPRKPNRPITRKKPAISSFQPTRNT